MAKKPVTIDDLDNAIDKWMTKLRRAANAIDALSIKRKRMLRPKRPTMIAIAVPQVETDHLPEPAFEQVATAMEPPGIELEIPEWLRRAGPIGDKTPTELKDLQARIEIETEQANKRIAKSRARVAKMKAKKAGDLKRMPLSGKAALDHIRNG